jgi:hypothetical protein
MPLVRTARLDNVRPKVVFGCGMLASIRREAGLLSIAGIFDVQESLRIEDR